MVARIRKSWTHSAAWRLMGSVALDRGEGITIQGEEQLANFMSQVGQRAADRVTRHSSGK